MADLLWNFHLKCLGMSRYSSMQVNRLHIISIKKEISFWDLKEIKRNLKIKKIIYNFIIIFFNNYHKRSKWAPLLIKKYKFRIWKNFKCSKNRQCQKVKVYLMITLQILKGKKMLAIWMLNQIIMVVCLEIKLNKISLLKCSKMGRKWGKRIIRKIKIQERKV